MGKLFNKPEFTKFLINLASRKLGAKVTSVTDDFFADAQRMLKDEEPIYISDKYDEHGKWMDGWESRRRRSPGHDYAVIKLGVRGKIKGIEIDTRYFTGNYPPQMYLEGSDNQEKNDYMNKTWLKLIPISNLKPDKQHFFYIKNNDSFTHLKLNIIPDGGIARIKVYGEPSPVWSKIDKSKKLELSSINLGGRIIGYNNAHYGNPWSILTPGRGINMGDGWETRRRRIPGNDWILVKMGAIAKIENIEIDTAHFKGNYPDSFSIQAIKNESDEDKELIENSINWPKLIDKTKLFMNQRHYYYKENFLKLGPINCLRLNIYPDGGISRFRVFGYPHF